MTTKVCPRGADLTKFPLTEEILEIWEQTAEDPQHREIIRLAKVGLWASRHSVAITNALQAIRGELRPSEISPYEKAHDSRPKEIR